MAFKFLNRALMTTSTTGTGTISLGSTLVGFQTFGAAGANNGDTVHYVIEDGAAWEIGLGTYTVAGTTLARTTLLSSSSGNKINLSGNAIVYADIVKEDFDTINDSFTSVNATLGSHTSSISSINSTVGSHTTSISTINSTLGTQTTSINSLNSTVGSHTTSIASINASIISINASLANLIPAGTLMLFQQTAAPTGWTKQTTHNDKALRVVSGAVSSGGSYAFSTVFARYATDSTILGEAHMPAHWHSFSGNTGYVSNDHTHSTYMYVPGGTFPTIYIASSGGHGGQTTFPTGGISANHYHAFSGGTATIGGSQGHTHNVEMRVQYVDLIIASKN